MNLRERLAELAHEQWSGWMKYLFEKSTLDIHGNARIPRDFAERWNRQIFTKYAELPENEKDSDRIEADNVLAIVGDVRRAALEEAAQRSDNFYTTVGQIDDSGKSAAFILGCQYAAEKISANIRALQSGVGLHASQQPLAVDRAERGN